MELLNQLAQNGLLALLLAIAYAAIAYLFLQYRLAQKCNDELQEKRITDYKEFATQYAKLADSVKTTLDTTIEVLKTKNSQWSIFYAKYYPKRPTTLMQRLRNCVKRWY